MPEPRILSAAEALCEGMDQCLAADPSVYVLGEGVTDPKAIFGTTAGLVQRHGPDRVVETPVSENALTGIAIGSALLGRRPVLVHQRVDFALLSLEQLFNNAAKTCYVSNGVHSVPIVVRMIVGRGWGQGPAHSQSLEALFALVPGLKVAMPTTARDGKGMLIAAIQDDNPVMLLEHRWFHSVRGEVPEAMTPEPLDGPRVVRRGSDATVLATSYMVYEAREAAEALADVGVEIEVIDLRVLRPLDLGPVEQSVRRTGRLVTVDTGHRLFGIGAEVVASIAERCFDALKAPPIRLGLPDHPTPSSRALAAGYYPGAVEIADAVARVAPDLADRIGEARAKLAQQREARPIDVPNPEFRGPF